VLPLALSTPSLPRTLTDRAVLIELGRVELQEGEGDIKTAEGGGVLALTGVLDLLSRHLSAVFDLYSPFKLLQVCQPDCCYDFDYLNLSLN